MDTVAIIGALDEEVALIAQSLQDRVEVDAASLTISRGRITLNEARTIEVVATVGGMGLVNAAATAQYLIDAYRPAAMMFSGIAGNLNPKLHINDVVLGGTLRYLDSDMRLIAQWKPKTQEFHSDGHLLDLADAALREMGITHVTGTIASGNYFVDTPERVQDVIRSTGADAVEMEGAAIAHVCARNDVPALVIRALSDNADTDYEVFKGFDIGEYADTAAKLALNIVKRL